MTSGPATTVAGVQARVRPRAIDGISALLLPYGADGQPDWEAYAGCLARTVAAGPRPAVNMDTGYVHLLTADERAEVLRITASVLHGRPFVAGAFVEGQAESRGGSGGGRVEALVARYCAEAEPIRALGGTPILFQCSALKELAPAEVVAVYRGVAERVGPILGFELGEMFAPF